MIPGAWRGTQRAERTRVTSAVLTGSRILVVERDPSYTKLLTILLDAAGAKVMAVATAEEALARITAFQPHLVTIDLVLPAMTGLALIEALKDDPRTRDVITVAVSGLQAPGIEARVLAGGAAALIRKPVSTDTFADTLANILGGRDA